MQRSRVADTKFDESPEGIEGKEVTQVVRGDHLEDGIEKEAAHLAKITSPGSNLSTEHVGPLPCNACEAIVDTKSEASSEGVEGKEVTQVDTPVHLNDGIGKEAGHLAKVSPAETPVSAAELTY